VLPTLGVVGPIDRYWQRLPEFLLSPPLFWRSPAPRRPGTDLLGAIVGRQPLSPADSDVTFTSHRLRRDVLSALRLTRLTLLLGVAAPGTARATDDSSKFSLSWARLPGAASCIPARFLAARVESRLHRSVFGEPSQADVAVEGYIQPAAAPARTGWKAVVSIIDAAGKVIGTREIESPEVGCRDLDASIALTIALLIDPNAELSPAETAPPNGPRAREKNPPSSPTPPRRGPGSPRAPSQSGAPLESWATLGGGVALGLLPHPAPGAVLRLGIRPGRLWPIVFQGALYREELQGAAAGSEPIGFSLASGGFALCPLRAEQGRGSLRLCAGLDAGLLATRGLADGAILVHRRFVTSPTGRLEGALHFGHFVVGAAAAVAVPLIRDTFEYEREGARSLVFREAPIGATFDLGLGYRSP
jgi:hypothetical protein